MRRCLIEPIPQLPLAAKILDAAADAILLNQTTLASDLIIRADDPEVMRHAMRIVGKMSFEVHRSVRRPTGLPWNQRHSTRMPSEKVQESIFARDGWRCRFCSLKVISRKSRSVLLKLFPIETHWDTKEFSRHSALYALAVSLDHVVPHSRGGVNEAENFVTACYCCQFGRGEWTLDEVELYDPRNYLPQVDDWDGLTRINELA